MKKTYRKPELHVEMFTLSQNVAACVPWGYEGTLGHPSLSDKGSCGWDMGNLIIWVNDDNCTEFFGVDEDVMGVCYNNPNGGVQIFGS